MTEKDARASMRDSKFGHLTLGQVMERNVQSGHQDDVAEVLYSMMMEGFGSIPIVDDENRLIGILSEFDLLNALRRGRQLNDLKAGDIMTPNPVSLTQGTDVLTAIDVLQNNHLIRVLVVDSSGKLIGIVTRRDILRGYLQTPH